MFNTIQNIVYVEYKQNRAKERTLGYAILYFDNLWLALEHGCLYYLNIGLSTALENVNACVCVWGGGGGCWH